ncbi:hypothetical protein U1Q18_045921 [Sarracenia purpurea var. burkii]
MESWSRFVVFSVLLVTTSTFVSSLELATVQASVPVVDECVGLPALFAKEWHYRNIFDVVIKQGTRVKFELLNPKSIENGEFSITCLQNINEYELELTFSKDNPFSYEILVNTTCVPTVGILKLCNSAPVNLIVKLTSMKNDGFQPLPIIQFKSFEKCSYVKQDVEKFLNRIIYYGFVKTPKAQVLIGRVDVRGLLQKDIFFEGLKVINDVIEKYREYSGRSSIPFPKGRGLQMNVTLEKDVLLLKSQLSSECDDVQAYYTDDRVVIMGDTISDFFRTGAETSRFVFQNRADYWMQQEDSSLVQKLYDKKTVLQNWGLRPRAHFLMALFTVDNHNSSLFRSYNIRTMNDPDILNNVLKSITIFIKDQCNINVAPFIEPVIYKEIPWLNLTNIYDLVESNSFRMPCFFYPSNETVYTANQFQESLKSTTNLRLCSTNKGRSKKIRITVENSELKNKSVRVNSVIRKISNGVIEMESSEEVFVIWGEINKTAVVLPAYTFCSSKTNYTCTVAPKLLTYENENPSRLLFPAFRFDIFGQEDALIAVLQVDTNNQKMLINTLMENGHEYFPNNEGAYVEMKLYNSLNYEVASYKINGTKTTVGETWFDIG